MQFEEFSYRKEVPTEQFSNHSTPRNEKPKHKESLSGRKVDVMNVLGYIPGVSTISGAVRTLIGIARTIINLAIAIIKWDSRHLENAVEGLKEVGRGIVEMIPIIGNISMLFYDRYRKKAELLRILDDFHNFHSDGGFQSY